MVVTHTHERLPSELPLGSLWCVWGQVHPGIASEVVANDHDAATAFDNRRHSALFTEVSEYHLQRAHSSEMALLTL